MDSDGRSRVNTFLCRRLNGKSQKMDDINSMHAIKENKFGRTPSLGKHFRMEKIDGIEGTRRRKKREEDLGYERVGPPPYIQKEGETEGGLGAISSAVLILLKCYAFPSVLIPGRLTKQKLLSLKQKKKEGKKE